MKWITALNLQQWAESDAAKVEFPGLVGDLIRASAESITAFRFPSGDKGKVRGFDGVLESDGAPPFVPEGSSIWEFGVTPGASKATDDYEKRTAQIEPEARKQKTFVYASPYTWNDPKTKIDDWVEAKRKLNEWRDVRYLDGLGVEAWLDANPGVAARYARYVLGSIPQTGARSTDEFWEEFAARFDPALIEAVLLCERDEQATNLLQKFGGGPGDIIVSGDSPDEVIAFAIASIRNAAEETRLFLEARTLVVETPEAARFLLGRKGLILLPRGQACQVGNLGNHSPTLIAMGRDPRGRSHDSLSRPSSQALGRAISQMGFPEEKGNELARSCGRSLASLSRLIPRGGLPQHPWRPHGAVLLPALLAGAWDSASEADTSVLSQLAGRSYREFESSLRPLIPLEDPPLDKEGSVWKIRAPVDAFIQLGHLVGPEDLERLRDAAGAVFSQIRPPPNPNDPFKLKSQSHTSHSSWLREGLASTLLLIAVLHRQAELHVTGQTAQQYVNSIVESLPGLNSDARMLASLSRELPLLAEAAPDPLLFALERLLEGEGTAVRPIFDEIDGILAPSSSHTGLLWALETLAWDPALLVRVTLSLAKLAAIDPGGNLGNRPIESLRHIFLPWTPQTNAAARERLAAIDYISKQVPQIAWDLLARLIPRLHDTAFPTSHPRLREAGASDRESLTYSIVWETQQQIVSRALSLATSPERWKVIIGSLVAFEPASRTEALKHLDAYLSEASGDAKYQVWSKVRDELNRNTAFATAAWALPKDEVDRLEKIVRRYEPKDQMKQVSWLFDDWAPHVPNLDDQSEDAVEVVRRDALRAIGESRGITGIVDLARIAKLPQVVASNFVEIAPDISACREILALAVSDGGVDTFSASLSAASAQRFKTSWIDCFRDLALQSVWAPSTIAELMFGWPESRSTWEAAANFGTAVEERYWRGKGAWIIRGDQEELIEGVTHYLRFGRPTAALVAAFNRVKDLPTPLIFDLLDAAVPEINGNPEIRNAMTAHHVERALETIEGRADASQLEIARREYAYLPMLQHRDRTLSIHRQMASDPEFYVSILKDAFRAASEPRPEEAPSEQIQARGRAGYRLLSSFRLVPGHDSGTWDEDALRNWIFNVRRLAAEADRSVIGEQYIGQVLAHAPADTEDGGWPASIVRGMIEELHSDEIERGIHIERMNMRGVYSKAMYEGGKQERALSAQTLGWAQVAAGYPRTASLLRRIAADWAGMAEREDLRARQDKLRDGM